MVGAGDAEQESLEVPNFSQKIMIRVSAWQGMPGAQWHRRRLPLKFSS